MKSKFKLFILISCIFVLFDPNVIHAYTTENGIEENDIVDLEFEGRLESTGEIFQPASRSEFEISIDSGFIEGFYEGVLGMKVDEDKTIIVPADKGYNNPETAPGKLFN